MAAELAAVIVGLIPVVGKDGVNALLAGKVQVLCENCLAPESTAISFEDVVKTALQGFDAAALEEKGVTAWNGFDAPAFEGKRVTA